MTSFLERLNMNQTSRRAFLQAGSVCILPALAVAGGSGIPITRPDDPVTTPQQEKPSSSEKAPAMNIYYLEIVTDEPEALIGQYTASLGLKFSEPEQALGGARCAKRPGDHLIGIRAPMHSGEKPVVRPYALVDDIQAAVAAAEKAGAKTAVPPMEIPGKGQCAIVMQGGIECGYWQV